ncbi:MAG: hypothetical protein WBQ94_00455 [Terracidiphilus sp.]
MRIRQWKIILAGTALLACNWTIAAAGAEIERESRNSVTEALAVQPLDPAAMSGAGFVRVPPQREFDRCTQGDVVSSPSRPNWDAGATTTQCGILESDFGWLGQPMGGGIQQRMLVSSMRFGLTPKLDLRWGLINRVSQSGAGSSPLVGVGDQCVNLTYRFLEQGRWVPAMAFSYGIKIPTANPAKGFGTGFNDHQFAFIASRDLGRNHLDFNTVGTLTGEAGGHDGAAQFGMALTRQMTGKLALILESYGGPQPGTADRYGAALSGVSFSLRSWLVLDGAYVKTYTAGAPRQQILFGFTFATRPAFGTIPHGSKFARLLGR